MTFAEMLARWPWMLAYVVVAVLLFLWLHRTSSTDQRASAELAHVAHGFGPPSRLRPIARDFWRLTCPRLLLFVVAVAWFARLLAGSWNRWDLPIVVGIIAFWPVQEWLVHVLLLHLKPFQFMGRQFDPIVSRNHRNHHQNPWNPELGITPAHIIWMYTAGLPGVWLLALPLPQALTGMATYFSLVLNYEWIHYLIHTSYVPRSWLYRRLWRNHRLHHFKSEQYWYGVTMLSGDWLLQTQPTPQAVDRSATVLTLGIPSEDGGDATEVTAEEMLNKQSASREGCSSAAS